MRAGRLIKIYKIALLKTAAGRRTSAVNHGVEQAVRGNQSYASAEADRGRCPFSVRIGGLSHLDGDDSVFAKSQDRFPRDRKHCLLVDRDLGTSVGT
jgi:hypothetical protein